MAKLYQSENVSGEDWSETQNLFKSLISTLPYESPFFFMPVDYEVTFVARGIERVLSKDYLKSCETEGVIPYSKKRLVFGEGFFLQENEKSTLPFSFPSYNDKSLDLLIKGGKIHLITFCSNAHKQNTFADERGFPQLRDNITDKLTSQGYNIQSGTLVFTKYTSLFGKLHPDTVLEFNLHPAILSDLSARELSLRIGTEINPDSALFLEDWWTNLTKKKIKSTEGVDVIGPTSTVDDTLQDLNSGDGIIQCGN